MDSTVGYCGADIKALCSEAALIALRRAYPQVYESSSRLKIDPQALNLGRGDFAAALQKVIPASRRSVGTVAKPLDTMLTPLLESSLHLVLSKVKTAFPPYDDVTLSSGSSLRNQDGEAWIASLTDVQDEAVLRGIVDPALLPPSLASGQDKASWSHPTTTLWSQSSIMGNPRVLISGTRGMGQSEIGSAVLQRLEAFQAFSLDFPSLLSDSQYVSPEQALVCRVQEAVKAAPSIIYFPDVIGWWRAASEAMRMALVSIVAAGMRSCSVLWLSTISFESGEEHIVSGTVSIEDEMEHGGAAEVSRDSGSPAMPYGGDERVQRLVTWLGGGELAGYPSFLSNATVSIGPGEVRLLPPTAEDRRRLFESFFDGVLSVPAQVFAARKHMLMSYSKSVELAVDTAEDKLPQPANVTGSNGSFPITEEEEEKERNCLRELRTFFRASLSELLKQRRLSIFSRPVDPEMVPDYYDIITNPMDLETMRLKVDEEKYPTYSSFLKDIKLILSNAKAYNPMTAKDTRGRIIVHAAHSMLDLIESHAYRFKRKLGYDLFKKCDEIHSKATGGILLRSGNETSLDDQEEAIMNRKYYVEVLKKHEMLKQEEQEEALATTSSSKKASNNANSGAEIVVEEAPTLPGSARRSLRGQRRSNDEDEQPMELVYEPRRKRRRATEATENVEPPATTLQEGDVLASSDPAESPTIDDTATPSGSAAVPEIAVVPVESVMELADVKEVPPTLDVKEATKGNFILSFTWNLNRIPKTRYLMQPQPQP